MNEWVFTGALVREDSAAPLAGASWYRATAEGDGMACRFPVGFLAEARYLTADFLLDGTNSAVFQLELAEGEKGPVFGVGFSLLNQCQARMRLPLDLVDQHTRVHPREGAWKNIICSKERVDLRKVDRMRFAVLRTGPEPARWRMTDITAAKQAPPLLTAPLLPKGKLIDEIGQYALRDWPGKSRDAAEVDTRLRRQCAEAAEARWPATFSRWGGCQPVQFEAT